MTGLAVRPKGLDSRSLRSRPSGWWKPLCKKGLSKGFPLTFLFTALWNQGKVTPGMTRSGESFDAAHMKYAVD
jgi:hypothetical protein